jgi:hypothetical protein
MHVVTGPDRLRGEADDLPVTAHRRALGDLEQRHLVAGGDRVVERDFLEAGQERALGQIAGGDRHVVLGVQANRRCGLAHDVVPSV